MLKTPAGHKNLINYLFPVVVLSYLFPVIRRRAFDDQNQVLELYLYRNQYQLGTSDALYSDGTRYKPMTVAFDYLGKEKLGMIKSVLVLGTGLASVVHILASKGYKPEYTLVERNETIMKWALELLPAKASGKVEPVLADAENFMQQQVKKYDLVIIDVFIGRVVPAFVTSMAFLEKCRQAVTAGRHLVINYMINNEEEWKQAYSNIQRVFPACKVLEQGINRIFIVTV